MAMGVIIEIRQAQAISILRISDLIYWWLPLRDLLFWRCQEFGYVAC